MNSKNLLGVVAGQSSVVAILTLALVLSIAGAPLLQQKKVVAQRIGAEVALTKAAALSEAILAGADGARSLDAHGATFESSHLRNALGQPDNPAAQTEFAQDAIAALRRNAATPWYAFADSGGTPHLHYAVPMAQAAY